MEDATDPNISPWAKPRYSLVFLSMGDYYRSDTPLAPLAWVGQFNVTF